MSYGGYGRYVWKRAELLYDLNLSSSRCRVSSHLILTSFFVHHCLLFTETVEAMEAEA